MGFFKAQNASIPVFARGSAPNPETPNRLEREHPSLYFPRRLDLAAFGASLLTP